jgi:rubrerythrin
MSDLDKPSRAEDEYFARQELERRKQWAKDRAAKMATEEKQKLRDLHYMKCPKCGMDLQTIELHGVKIDQCPSCNGVWLDAGELEQLTRPESSGVFQRIASIFGG